MQVLVEVERESIPTVRTCARREHGEHGIVRLSTTWHCHWRRATASAPLAYRELTPPAAFPAPPSHRAVFAAQEEQAHKINFKVLEDDHFGVRVPPPPRPGLGSALLPPPRTLA